MTVALITGSHGFVGSHLRVLLRATGWRVVGLGRRAVEPAGDEDYIRADVTNRELLVAILRRLRPNVIFHLAAPVGQRGNDPQAVVRSLVLGTEAVCSAIREAGFPTRLVLAGSSAQYGDTPTSHAQISEDAPCRPISAYGYAKLAAEAAAFGLALDGAFELIAARPFNHVGPGEGATTVAGAIAAQIAALLDGRAQGITITDVDAVRDFTDVRDIARGYIALAERGTAGRTYNLCSGRGASVGDVLDGLLDAAGLSRSVVEVVPGGGSSLARQVGSPARVLADTGWRAEIPLAASLRDLLASAQAAAVRASAVGSERAAGGG